MENPKQQNAFPDHAGSERLIEKYNINDQAHSDSSAEDFIKTVSEYHHADENTEDRQSKIQPNTNLNNFNHEKTD